MRILDTDTCVEILRGNAAVIARRASVDDDVATTWVTAAELYFGAARSIEPAANRAIVDEFLESCEVVGLDRESARVFGQTKADLRSAGAVVPDADLLIGSIALCRDAVLVTGNTRHFGRFRGLRIEDWIR